MRTLTWIGIGMLLVAGCSSDKDFSQKYAEAICAKNFQCCPASELVDKTQSQCVMNNEFPISILMAEISDSKARGRANYDASKSSACVDALNAMTCDEFKQGGGNMAACMAFVTPNVQPGGACTQGYECTTGNCEDADTSVDPPVDGTCGPAITLAALGESCAAAECVDGAYCDSATTTCLKLRGAGEACTSSTQCVNSCDTTTSTCTCYSGCNVANGTTAGGAALSLLLFGAGLVVRRSRRRARA